MYEIAVRYGFLWRSYYKKTGRANGKVQMIKQGDLIVLAYRVPGDRFRVLLPLVVEQSSPFTVPIDTRRFSKRD